MKTFRFLHCAPTVLLMLGLSSFVVAQEASPVPNPPVEQAANPATQNQAEAMTPLAEHLVEVAQSLLPPADRPLPPAVARQTAALLEGAMRLNPSEPRYPRLLADVRADLRDPAGEIDAWVAYRKLVPDDRVAQIRVIDLYLGRIETNDKKVGYIKDLLDKPTLAPEVKAHIAATAVPLLEQRSHEEAMQMLSQARQFYALPEVTRLQYVMLPQDATPVQRLAAMLDMIRSNPAQPDVMELIGHQLSAAGLPQEAAGWFATAFSYEAVTGGLPTHAAFAEYLSDLVQTGQTQNLPQGIDRMLQVDPNDADAWFLRLTSNAGKTTPEMLNQARTAFTNRLNLIAARIVQNPAATQPAATQPAAPPADLTAAAARLKELNNPALTDAYVSALSDLAWFDLYYANKPDDASKWINGLKVVLPADSPVVQRFQGWHDLLTNRAAEARQELSAAQATDALAALGMLRLAQQEKKQQEADAVARRLQSQPHGGVLGAIVSEALKSAQVPPATQPASSEIQAELQKFPRDWMDVLRTPNKFYQLRGEPVHIAHRLGEPMFARVTIENIGKYDLVIGSGANGLIQPELWFDAAIRGVAQQQFPGIAADQIMLRTVLRPREGITQIVRIDQRELGEVLRQTPIGMISIEADVLTNPMPYRGQITSAPGGYGVRFTKIFSQIDEPLNSDLSRTKFLNAMQSASPADKLNDLELLAAYVRRYAARDAGPDQRAIGGQFLDVILKTRTDPDPGVAVWASYVAATLLQGPSQQKIVEEMTAAQAPWESRLLGLAASRGMALADQKKLASTLAENDPEPMVKMFAAAALDLLEHPATQPAATQPGK